MESLEIKYQHIDVKSKETQLQLATVISQLEGSETKSQEQKEQLIGLKSKLEQIENDKHELEDEMNDKIIKLETKLQAKTEENMGLRREMLAMRNEHSKMELSIQELRAKIIRTDQVFQRQKKRESQKLGKQDMDGVSSSSLIVCDSQDNENALLTISTEDLNEKADGHHQGSRLKTVNAVPKKSTHFEKARRTLDDIKNIHDKRYGDSQRFAVASVSAPIEEQATDDSTWA